MKLGGREIKGPNVEYIVIPRPDGDIILKAQAVLDMKEFEKMVPAPNPPIITVRGGATEPDLKDKSYLHQLQRRNHLRYGYLFMQSLSVTEGLEWELMKADEPDTWDKWEEELRNAGFSNPEVNMVMDGISAANGLNAEKLEQARKRFFAGLITPTSSLSLMDEQQSTPSGEPASASG